MYVTSDWTMYDLKTHIITIEMRTEQFSLLSDKKTTVIKKPTFYFQVPFSRVPFQMV